MSKKITSNQVSENTTDAAPDLLSEVAFLRQQVKELWSIIHLTQNSTQQSALGATVIDDTGMSLLHVNSDQLDSDEQSEQLIITISNQTSSSIEIPTLSGELSSTNYHVALSFLEGDSFYFYTLPTIDTSTPAGWQLITDGETDSNGGAWVSNIYLANTGSQTQTLMPQGQSGDSLQLIIDYAGIVPASSTEDHTSVQVKYSNMTSGGSPIQGSLQSLDLDLLMDVGRSLPLAGAFIGRTTVLNDGTTSNTLTLRLTNTSKAPMQLIPPPSGKPTQSYIEILLPVSDSDINALCTTNEWTNVQVNLVNNPPAGWRAEPSTTYLGLITLTPDYSTVQYIPPQGTIDVEISSVLSSLSSGIVQALVTVHNFVLYGTQTFGVTLEKSPLVYNSGPGMKLLAGTLGENNALTITGDSSAELVSISQTGSGTALQVDGGIILINKGATVTGGLTTDTATVSEALTAKLLTANGGATVMGGLTTDTATVSEALTAKLLTANGGATVTGGLTTDTATVSEALTANGGATVMGGLTTDTATVSEALTANGGATVRGGLTTDTATFTGDLTISNNYFLDSRDPADFFVGGWGDSTESSFDLSNGTICTVGGESFLSVEGFSATYGTGNYGYYRINLNQNIQGMLYIDMYIGCHGQGFWNIMTSDAILANSWGGNARQVWESYQDLSWGQVNPYDANAYNGNGTYFVRKIVSAYFKGQYIYIGAIDLGQGQVAIALNNVVVTPFSVNL